MDIERALPRSEFRSVVRSFEERRVDNALETSCVATPATQNVTIQT